MNYKKDKSKKLKDKKEKGFLSFTLYPLSLRRGFGLIEIVVVVGIVSGALFVFSQAGAFALKLLRHEKESLEMTLLAQEGLEAVRSLRDESWASNIDAHDEAADHFIVLAAGKWVISHTPAPPIGQYVRTVRIEQAYRNAEDRISASGILDPGTVRVTVRVTKPDTAITLVGYFTDFQQFISSP